MEEFSYRVAEALGAYAKVRVVARPGRPDGRPPARSSLLPFLLRATGNLIRYAWRSDIVVLGDFVLSGLAPIARVVAPQTSTVIAVHGLDLLYAHGTGVWPRLYHQYIRTMVRLRSSIDAVVANSESTAAVARGLGLPNVTTVRLGVQPPLNAPARACERDRHKILFVGRLVRRKGAAWLATHVLPLLPGSEFVVVGRSEDPTEARLLDSSPATTYLGSVARTDLRDLRNSCWIAVVPNIDVGSADMEGFGLTAVEAAAEGCVVVGADLEGIADAIIDGVTGFHAPSGDAERWAEMISDIQSWDEARYDSFQAGAAEALAEHYSWDRVAREILRVGAISDGLRAKS